MYVFGSLERLHAVVARATNSDASDDHHRVLWRLDKASHGAMQRLYIVSPSEPDRSVFEEELGVNVDRDCSSCDYGPFLRSLESGQEWAFRVTVNPTHSVPSEGFASRGPLSARFTTQCSTYRNVNLSWIRTKDCNSGGLVNPTHSVPSEGFASRGRRQPIVRRDKQTEWLFKKFRKIALVFSCQIASIERTCSCASVSNPHPYAFAEPIPSTRA